MTEKPSIPGDRAYDLGALAADTMLLDALGRGEPAPADDEVASLLAAWRADLNADLDSADLDSADLEPVGPVAAESGAVAAGAGAALRTHRLARRVLGAAAAVLIAGGGLLVGAGHATPGNPLWPITRVMYPERADNVAAERALAQARDAVTHGRPDDARRLLARAETLIARVSDPDRAQRLRAELATVRDLLTAAVPAPSTPAVPTPAPTGAPDAPGETPTSGGPAPQPTGAVPQPTVTSGATPPGISIPPLPSLPVPPPSLRLPTVDPTLPGLPPVGSLLPRLP